MIRERILFTALAVVLAALSGGAAAVAPADKAPAFAAPLIGKSGQLDTRALSGKVYYIDFWASLCGPCRASFPMLDKLYAQHREQGFVVVGINQDDRLDDAQRFLERIPVNFPLIADADHRIAESYKVSGMPSGILVDRKGVVRHVVRGFRGGEEVHLAKLVTALIEEK